MELASGHLVPVSLSYAPIKQAVVISRMPIVKLTCLPVLQKQMVLHAKIRKQHAQNTELVL